MFKPINSKAFDKKEDINTSKLYELIQTNIDLSEKLMKFDKSKTEFFANISHELKTPINIILSSSQLIELFLKKDQILSNEMLEKHITTVKQNSLRLIRLINNLVDLTRAELGYYALNIFHVDINKLIRNIALSSEEYFNSNNQKLIIKISENPSYVKCDPEKIERIVLNLLSNAAKFTPSHGEVSIQVKNSPKQSIICVSDTGIGIPNDCLDLVFDNFKQIDNNLDIFDKGSGIGLALCKVLIELHKGSICVESKVGKGSKFTIKLPTLCRQTDKNIPIHHSSNSHDEYKDKFKMEFSDIL